MSLSQLSTDAERALDVPIWAALSSRHSHLGRSDGTACFYRSDVAPFAAAGPADEQDIEGLVRLAAGFPDGLTLLQSDELPKSEHFTILRSDEGVQMIATRSIEPISCPAVWRLTRSDVQEMIALVDLAKPGPFRRNTPLMGGYFGIKCDGKLVALAGERMKIPGYTEISAVCVHPNYRGRGFAKCLTSHVACAIRNRGETPFLHAYANNFKAISLYRSLGFEIRRKMYIASITSVSH